MTIAELYIKFLETDGVSTDTRKFLNNKMFFALKGANFDGNTYASSALKAGAKYVIIDNPDYQVDPACILVDDTLKTLQELAIHHRKQLNIPVIGITGSNGKTTTKELISTVLAQKYDVLATEGNLNNHIGVPLTILSIKNNVHDIAVIEMGANHLGEIAELCQISQPNFGVLTNIGAAHLEGFGDLEGVKKTKKAIYEYVAEHGDKVFVNGDDPVLMDLTANQHRCLFGSDESFCLMGGVKSQNPQLEIFAQYKGEKHIISTQLVGAYNIANILTSISIGLHFDVPIESIAYALTNYIPQNNRSQLIKTKQNTVLLDCYNANPTSMKEAIQSFNSMKYSEKYFILGDMKEMGKYSEEKHLQILHLLDQLNVENVILVGPEFAQANTRNQYPSFQDTAEVKKHLESLSLKTKAILLKGSRGIGLEKLVEVL